MTIDITVAVADTARVGEGPFWDAAAGRLHWVDILSGAISSYTPSTGKRTRTTLPTLVGAAVPKASGGYIAATREGFADVTAGGAWATRLHILDDGIRMNDAKCDPVGRLWAGSTQMDFAAGRGALHVLDPEGRTETVLDGLTLGPARARHRPHHRRQPARLARPLWRRLAAARTERRTGTRRRWCPAGLPRGGGGRRMASARCQ